MLRAFENCILLLSYFVWKLGDYSIKTADISEDEGYIKGSKVPRVCDADMRNLLRLKMPSEL